MTPAQTLDLLMLLSAVEAWSFATEHRMPDHLYNQLETSVDLLLEQLIGDGK